MAGVDREKVIGTSAVNDAMRLKHALGHYPPRHVIAATRAVLERTLRAPDAETMALLVAMWIADADSAEPPPLSQAQVEQILLEARSSAS